MDDIKPPGRGPRPRTNFFNVPEERNTSSEPVRRPAEPYFNEPALPKNSEHPVEQKPAKPEANVDDIFSDLSIDKPKKSKKNKEKKPKSRKKKFFYFLLILLLAAGLVYWFVLREKTNPAVNQVPTEEKKAAEKLTGNFRILATGDIITHDSVNQNAKQPDGSISFAPMLSLIKPILEKAPARICHNTVPAAGGNISGYPSFNAPSELIPSLGASGCNVLSLASDHINDKGQSAIDATVTAVEQTKEIVIYSGANKSAEDQAKEKVFNVGDGAVKFGYLSYTTKQSNPSSTPFGVNVYSSDKSPAEVKAAREKYDIVIVSMCWGKEDSGDIQPEQDQIAQALSDAGADIVLGHCPHFVQPVKTIQNIDGSRNTVVFYSLGNTLNSQLPIEALIGGIGVVDIDIESKKITQHGFLPTYMHYEWTAAEKSSNNLNARKNLKLYPLDQAGPQLAASQNGTDVAAQTTRITEILNRFTATKIFTSEELK